MLFSFVCPSCGGQLEADSSLSGGQAVCAGCGTPVAVPEGRVEPGTVIGGFQLESRLGKGGMGEVFLAHQISVDRKVAVKILPPGFADNESAVQRFLQEGRLAARLDHPNIATIHKAGEDDGTYYLAMAYVEGESLDRRVKREGALPEAEALAIVRAVAEALAYAWETFQIIHRDIKPANIMVDVRQRVFLMDLGLAKSLGQESGMTLSGTILGTPRYMSPEQARGQADLGAASDVYSLGATLYHLATGTPAFDGESLPVLLHKHVYEPLPPPRERNPALSKGCARLIERMMEKKPEDRHADWQELLAEVDRLLAGEELRERPSAVASIAPERGETGAHESLAQQARQALARQRKSVSVAGGRGTRSLRAMGAVAAVLLAVLACVAVVARRHGRREDPSPTGRDGGTSSLPADRGGEPPAHPAAGMSPSPAHSHSRALDSRQSAGASLPAVPGPTAEPTRGQDWAVPGIGMEFVWIEPMGLWVGKYEVTNGEYRAKEAEHCSGTYGEHNLDADRQPVVAVDLDEAAAFAGWLTQREREAGRLPDTLSYRLPTEPEFTVYVECGDGRLFPWGNDWPPQWGNYHGQEGGGDFARIGGHDDGWPVSCRVEQSGRNPLGLFGVGGNVMEIVTLGESPNNAYCVWRGGSWIDGRQESVRCATTSVLFGRGRAHGFRLVLAPTAPPLVPVPPAKGSSWSVRGTDMEFVWIEPLGIWVAKHETTNAQYRRGVPSHDSGQWQGRSLKGGRQPVVNVNWQEACEYADWLTSRERMAGRLPADFRFRLPTREEFLTYAQCGDDREFPWGDRWPPPSGTDAGNYRGEEFPLPKRIPGYRDQHVVACPVRQTLPNDWNLCGVGGNVWEPCAADTGARQSLAGFCGASWFDWDRETLRCAFLLTSEGPLFRNFNLGFRLVLVGPSATL